MYHWVGELSPPLTIKTHTVTSFAAWNNAVTGCYLWRAAHQRCIRAWVYGRMFKTAASTATCKSEHKCREMALLDPAVDPLGSYTPFGLFPSIPFSVIFCPILGPDVSFILLNSSWSSTLLLFSLVWTSILPPSFHTSGNSPPPSTPASSHKMEHIRSQESKPCWLFPYPETQKYKVNTNRGCRDDLPQPTHLASLSPSRAWSWPGEGRSWSLLKVPRACKDSVWLKINNQL